MSRLKYYKTSEVAGFIGVHPNTVRLYEDLGLLQPVPRDKNGYRLYTIAHIEQMRLARIALRNAFVEGNIRKLAISIVKTSAKGNPKLALEEAYDYLVHIKDEQNKANEVLQILRKFMNQEDESVTDDVYMRRKNAAESIDVSPEALRNWERNGLIVIPRNKKNGYRVYGQKEIDRARLIRTMRAANFSLMAILRMFKTIDAKNTEVDITNIVSTPEPDEDMAYATDRWLLTLSEAEKNAEEVINQIKRMIHNKSILNL